MGLATSLLGIETKEQVARDPLLGGLFENLVVLEALKARFNRGKQLPELYYYRIQGRQEVDLVIHCGQQLIPVEIKAAMTFSSDFANHLKKFIQFAPNCVKPTVLYAGEENATLDGIHFENFRNTAKLLDEDSTE